MKNIHINLLKKFNIVDIQKMRKMKREGYNTRSISDKFGCAYSTAYWHTADIPERGIQKVF